MTEDGPRKVVPRKDFAKLITSIIIPQSIGIIGALFTIPSIGTWYAGLNKPSFNPPNWIFGPVWTVLYLLMGIALYLVWKKGLARYDARQALAAFAAQLVLNLAWTFFFFFMNIPLAAFVEIIILWISIAVTARLFFRVSRTAGLLLIPYIMWVSYAALLNFMLWHLNR